MWLDGRPILYEKWGDLTQDQRRRHMRQYVGSVTVRSCGKRGRWVPISNKVTWKDGSEPVLLDE